jgi:hypothetical protein
LNEAFRVGVEIRFEKTGILDGVLFEQVIMCSSSFGIPTIFVWTGVVVLEGEGVNSKLLNLLGFKRADTSISVIIEVSDSRASVEQDEKQLILFEMGEMR